MKVNKELKSLNRRELVDIIYQMKKNEQDLQAEIEALNEQLQDKRMRLTAAGSIADAAVSVTDVFSTAQATADLYLNEIECMKKEMENAYAKRTQAVEAKVQEIIEDGEKKFAALQALYKDEYAKWRQLKAEVAALEQKKEALCEGMRNDG